VAGQLPAGLGQMVPGAPWLIWSNAGAGWVNAAQTGYTRLIEKAGRFTLEQAKAAIVAAKAQPLVHGKLNAVAVPDYALSTPVPPIDG
jgi:hypothetical protein